MSTRIASSYDVDLDFVEEQVGMALDGIDDGVVVEFDTSVHMEDGDILTRTVEITYSLPHDDEPLVQ